MTSCEIGSSRNKKLPEFPAETSGVNRHFLNIFKEWLLLRNSKRNFMK